MWLHFAIIILILLLLYFGRGNNKFLCVSLFTLFFVLAAFRSTEVGNDTQEYYRIFQSISKQSSLKSALTISRYEYGYIIYNFLISRFTNNFQWILAINAGVYLATTIWFMNRYAKSFGKAVCLFFSFGLYYNVMNLERQCIATAIFLIAIPFLENKKYFKYILIILFAATFHSTALILITLVLIPKIDFSKPIEFYKWGMISILFLVALNYGISYIERFSPYLSHYLIDSIYSEGGIRTASIVLCLIRVLCIGLLLIVNGRIYQDGESEISNIFNKFLLIDCIISIASIGFNMYDRIEKYVCIGFIIAVINAINVMKNDSNKKISFGMIFGISFAYLTISLILRPEWSGIFPYTFFVSS